MIKLDHQASRPLYLQIKDQLQERIERGTLLPGTKLPSSRTLADELDVSRVTVVNAYAELEVEGLAEGHVGRGTFVTSPECPAPPRVENPFDWRTTLLRPSGVSASGMLADMLNLAQQPDLISFALGAPATNLLPVRPFREAINRAMRRGGAAALQYDDATGYAPLRRAILDLVSPSGIDAPSSDVLITSGSQQALDLTARVLTQPGDVVITERPTYLGALDVFQSYGLEVLGVPVDAHGMRLDALEELMADRRPKLVYTIPAFQNPTGATLSEERRSTLLALARQHDFHIIEDAVCSELSYEGTLPPPLKALDEDRRVIHINSFSKFLLPGIRVGYVIASGRARERLLTAKRATDLFTSSLLQRALFEYLASGDLVPHLDAVRDAYRRRRDTMLAALSDHLPAEARWTRPCGGLCLWVTLPSSINTAQLYLAAIDHGVAYAVGAVFYPHRPTSSSLRLNFAAHPPERIVEGITRLAKAVRDESRPRLPAAERVPPTRSVHTQPYQKEYYERLSIRDIVLSGVMIALVAVFTLAIRIPFALTRGYFNFSDVGVFLAGFAFGPWIGLVAGGVGGALADIVGGYPMYAPLTMVAHGLEGLVAGLIVRRHFELPRMIAGWAAGALVMVAIYFVGEAYILQMGLGPAAAEAVSINIPQVVVGGIVSIPLVKALVRAYPPILQWGHWPA